MAFKIGEAFVEVTAEDSTRGDTEGIGRRLTTWAGSLGLGALIGSQINSGLNIESGRANLQNQLGLTAEDAATYSQLAGDVYRSNFGESLEEVNGVIGRVGDAMGGLGAVTNDEISDMTGEILTMSGTFGVDAVTSISSLQSAVSNGLAPSLRDATDIATRVFQEGGPKAEEFLDVINEYGPNLEQAGISMEQFGAMSVSYLDAGGYSIDQFADSIREMNIRILDGSAASAGAFDTLGLNAEEMTAKIAAGGPGAQEAMQQVIAAIGGMTDPVAQQTAGAQLFGSMWEDSSGAILAGLTPLPDALGQVEGATNTMTEVAGSTGASRIEAMKRQLGGLLTGAADLPGPLGTVGAAINAIGIESLTTVAGSAAMIGSFVIQNGETIKNTTLMVANGIAKGAQATATGVATAAQWLWNAALSANPIALVIIAITALVAGLVWFFTQTEAGRAVIEAVWGAIKSAIGATVDWITGTVVPALTGAWQWIIDSVVNAKNWIVDTWNSITSAISNAASSIWNTITSIIGNVVSWLSNAWNGALNVVRSVWGGISGFISNAIGGVISLVQSLPGTIISLFSNAGSWLVSAGGNIVRGIWNGISGMASWLWNKVTNFASNIVDNVLGALGINSPSRVFRDEVGKWIPAGVAVGIDENMRPLERSLADMTDVRGPTMQASGVFDATGMPGVGSGPQAGIVSTTPTGTVIQINNLTLQIEGNFDFSNPIDWQRFIEAVRDGLVNLERQYR